MRKLSIGRILAMSLLVAGTLNTPIVVVAQGPQHNESDLEFARRMVARIDRVEKQADRLHEFTAPKNGFSMNQPDQSRSRSGQEDFGVSGSRSRTADFAGADETRLTKTKLKSVQRTAKKEREKLSAVQGSKSKPDELDRKSIESTVTRMERDIADVEKEIRKR